MYDVCQLPAQGQGFSWGIPVSSATKTDCHDIAEILMKVALNSLTRSYFLSSILEKKFVVKGRDFSQLFHRFLHWNEKGVYNP